MVETVFLIDCNDVNTGLNDVDRINIAKTDDAFQNILFFIDFRVLCQLQRLGKLIDRNTVFLAILLLMIEVEPINNADIGRNKNPKKVRGAAI